ncbi:MAG: 1-acyl-sn-glycerol-3-phosphate acyltransferase [Chitinophagales bacterium]|nr:1-acyl-sn-glycerol-3-phosphate acyltransferase [Chitinophagales bacterium]
MKAVRKIWALFGAVIFIVTILVFAPMVVLFKIIGGKPQEWFIKKSYYYIPRILFTPCFITFETYGLDNIDINEKYIIVSNHKSLLDIFANPACSPFPFKFLAKDEIRRIPFVGWVASNFCVFVKRRDKISRGIVLTHLKEALANGTSILVYPEGTRNRSEKPLLPFYDGAFRLAIETGTPIAIQTLLNTDNFNAADKALDLHPGKVKCSWSPPIDTSALTIDDLPFLKERVTRIMIEELESYHSEKTSHPDTSISLK